MVAESVYKNDKSNIVQGPISASIEACIGDLMILEDGLLVPADKIIDQGSFSANQSYAAERFAGVASENSDLNSDNEIHLWSFGEFEMGTTTPGLTISEKVTFAEGEAGKLSRNKIEKTELDSLAIGVIVRRSPSGSEEAWFRLQSRVFSFSSPGIGSGMVWFNNWKPGTYAEQSTVIDNGWSMVANKTTSDRPRPTITGDPEFTQPDDQVFDDFSNASVNYIGMFFTAVESGYIDRVRVFMNSGMIATSEFYAAIINVTDPENFIYYEIEIPADSLPNTWIEIEIPLIQVKAGDTFKCYQASWNDSGHAIWEEPWVYKGAQASPFTPGAGEISFNEFGSKLLINVVDNNSVNQGSNIFSMAPEAKFTLTSDADPTRSEVYKVITSQDTPSAGVQRMSVSLIEVNNGGLEVDELVNVEGDYILFASSDILENTPFWNTASVSWAVNPLIGFQEFDGIDFVTPNAAGPIDISLTPSVVSPDWDFLAHSTIEVPASGSFRYLVGPPESNAPFLSVQDAVTAAELAGGASVIPILPGKYTENVTITKNNIVLYGFSGLGDNSPVDAALTEIIGDVNYTGTQAQYLSISNLLISGQVFIEGTEPVILWLNDSRISTTGQSALELENNDGVTRVIARDCVFNTTDASTAVNISGACSVFFTDCQVTTNDGGLGTANAIETSAGGDGVNLTNCFVNGRILKTAGTAGGTLRGAATVIQVASGPCVNKTGGSGAFFYLDTNFFSGGGNCIAGGSAGDNFVQSIALQFGTGINNSIVTKLDIDAEVLYDAAVPANWNPLPVRVREALDQLAAQVGGGLLLDPIILVRTLADLPTPVGNVIQLLDDKFYLFIADINIGDNTIDVSGAKVAGLGSQHTSITTGFSFTGPVFRSIGKSVDISGFEIFDFLGNKTIFDIQDSPGTNTVKISDIKSILSDKIAVIDDMAEITFSDCEFRNANTNGIALVTSTQELKKYVVKDCVFENNAGSSVDWSEPNSVIDVFITSCQFDVSAGQSALEGRLNSQNMPVGSAQLTNNIFKGAGTYLDTMKVCNDQVFSNHNIGLTETINLDPIIYVREECDLPAAVANVITLVPGKTYLFLGVVSLTGDNRIDMNGANIKGLGFTISTILSSSLLDQPLLTNINLQGTSVVEDINLNFANGSLFDFQNTLESGFCKIINVNSLSYDSIGLIKNYSEVFIHNSDFDDTTSTTGLKIEAGVGSQETGLVEIKESKFLFSTGTAIDFTVGDFDQFTISDTRFDIASGAIGIKGLLGNSNVNRLHLFDNIFTNTGTFIDQIIVTDAGVYARDNDGWTDYLNPIVYVRSEADLPAAVANVITLVPGKTYFFLEVVFLSGDNRIDMNGANLSGISPEFSGIFSGSALNQDLLSNNNFFGSSIIENLNLSNGNGRLFDFTNTIASGSTRISNCSSGFYDQVGLIKFYTNITIENCDFTGNIHTNGIKIEAGFQFSATHVNSLIIRDNCFQQFTGACIDFSVGEYGSVSVFNNEFSIGFGDTAIKGVVGSTNILSEFRMYGNTFLGNGTYLEDMSICDPPVYANSNLGEGPALDIQNSLPKTAAFIAAGDEATTVIALVNTPVVVAGTWTESGILCKFDDNGNPGDGDLRYTGLEANILTFMYKLMIEPTSGTNKQYTVYVRENGTTLNLSSRDVVNADANNPSKIVGVAQIQATTNAVFELVVENNTDDQDCLVTAASIVIQGSA
jgi:hypothetical protein